MAKKRRDINSLTDIELQEYIHAINILRQRSQQNPDDESGYDFQAALHNDVFVGPCEHGNDLFLPWHRAHLHYFEKLLQESDPPRTSNVTIPYWDWLHNSNGQNSKFPAAFSVPGLNMSRNENNADLPSDTLEIVIGEREWKNFGGYPKGDQNGDYGRLELGPHNKMHGDFIGGKMGSPATAAEDPIYFSFHAFIDLLWAEWQRRNSTPPHTSPDADLRGFINKPRRKAGDFQITTDLDYDYEYTNELHESFEASITRPLFINLTGSQKLQPLFSDRLSKQLEKSTNAQFSVPIPPNNLAVIQLRNLKIPHTGSYTLWAYLHPQNVSFDQSDEQFKKDYNVGYVSLWKAHTTEHNHHHTPPAQQHHPSSCIVRFDLQKVLSKVDGEAVGNLIFTLYYVPAPNSEGQPQPGSQVVREIELNDILLETYTE